MQKSLNASNRTICLVLVVTAMTKVSISNKSPTGMSQLPTRHQPSPKHPHEHTGQSLPPPHTLTAAARSICCCSCICSFASFSISKASRSAFSSWRALSIWEYLQPPNVVSRVSRHGVGRGERGMGLDAAGGMGVGGGQRIAVQCGHDARCGYGCIMEDDPAAECKQYISPATMHVSRNRYTQERNLIAYSEPWACRRRE